MYIGMSELPDDGLEPVTFHAPRGTRDRLLALAHERGHTLDEELIALVEDALAEEAEERQFRADDLAAVKRLQADPEAWADYLAELEEFDGLRPARVQYPEYQHSTRESA